jgi:hypothetical protein
MSTQLESRNTIIMQYQRTNVLCVVPSRECLVVLLSPAWCTAAVLHALVRRRRGRSRNSTPNQCSSVVRRIFLRLRNGNSDADISTGEYSTIFPCDNYYCAINTRLSRTRTVSRVAAQKSLPNEKILFAFFFLNTP